MVWEVQLQEYYSLGDQFTDRKQLKVFITVAVLSVRVMEKKPNVYTCMCVWVCVRTRVCGWVYMEEVACPLAIACL